jgi:hypothetical protein
MSEIIGAAQAQSSPVQKDWFDSRDVHIRAVRSFQTMIARGADHYQRHVVLPKLLPVSAHDLINERWSDARIIRALERAVRRERQNGRARHWSYNINKHISLLQALKAERSAAAQNARRGKSD